MTKKIKISLLVLFVTVVGLVAVRTTDPNYFEISRNLDIFSTLFKEVNTYYVDEIDPEVFIEVGIRSMLASLDPYTNYIPESQAEEYRTMTTGQYGGIGASVGVIKGRTLITLLYEGYGAHKAGLQVGDEIVSIDGTILDNPPKVDATTLLKGQPGSQVTVVVKRHGQNAHKTFTFDREKIKIENVPYHKLLEKGVGYIRLSDFTLGASKEVSVALNALKEQGANSIILDIRSNPGGLLSEAVNVSNVFITKGLEIVSTKGKIEEWNQTYNALNPSTDNSIPLAILINSSSASASEIVAGVVQDYDRGVLVGRRTFGKGLVQATRQLSYNSQLKVTTAKYYIPSGRSIQAIDYALRNDDGSVSLIPDSLKVPFKTANGRVVYDGGGLEPDIKVQGKDWSEISHYLLTSGYIFEYATIFCQQHPKVNQLENFELSNAQYQSFIDWIKGQDIDFRPAVQSKLEEFIATAKDHNYSDNLQEKAKQIKNQIILDNKSILLTYQEELKKLLTQEILSRYMYRKGDIIVALRGDGDLREAINILTSPSKYRQILSE